MLNNRDYTIIIDKSGSMAICVGITSPAAPKMTRESLKLCGLIAPAIRHHCCKRGRISSLAANSRAYA